MIEGTGPNISSPGAGPEGTKDGTVAESGRDSGPKLLALAEPTEAPAELCRPSDLCEEVRSVIGRLPPPRPLPVRSGRKSVEVREK